MLAYRIPFVWEQTVFWISVRRFGATIDRAAPFIKLRGRGVGSRWIGDSYSHHPHPTPRKAVLTLMRLCPNYKCNPDFNSLNEWYKIKTVLSRNAERRKRRCAAVLCVSGLVLVNSSWIGSVCCVCQLVPATSASRLSSVDAVCSAGNVSNCLQIFLECDIVTPKGLNFSRALFSFSNSYTFSYLCGASLNQKHLQTQEDLSAVKLITKALQWYFLSIPKSFIHPHRFDRRPSKSLTISSVFFLLSFLPYTLLRVHSAFVFFLPLPLERISYWVNLWQMRNPMDGRWALIDCKNFIHCLFIKWIKTRRPYFHIVQEFRNSGMYPSRIIKKSTHMDYVKTWISCTRDESMWR